MWHGFLQCIFKLLMLLLIVVSRQVCYYLVAPTARRHLKSLRPLSSRSLHLASQSLGQGHPMLIYVALNSIYMFDFHSEGIGLFGAEI